jgi:hypothetical protein
MRIDPLGKTSEENELLKGEKNNFGIKGGSRERTSRVDC